MKPPVKMGFEALVTGWVAGRRVQAGEVILLTVEEAKYEQVAAVAMAGRPEPAPAPRRKGRAK